MAAVDLIVDDAGDLLQYMVACQVAARIVDGLEVVDVEDGEGELEPSFTREFGKIFKAAFKLMAVVTAREEIALCSTLRCCQLLCEHLVLPHHCRLLHHLETDDVKDERNHRIDGEYGDREHTGEQMVFPVQRINDTEQGGSSHSECAVAAGGMELPVRACEEIDEPERSGQEERVVEIEQRCVPALSAHFKDGCRGKGSREGVENFLYLCAVVRCDNLVHEQRPGDWHDVEHGQMQLPPEEGQSDDAREEGGYACRPQHGRGEAGDEIDLGAAQCIARRAPREIDGEECDHRESDGECCGIGGAGEADAREELLRCVKGQVVDRSQPARLIGVQEQCQPLPCHGITQMNAVKIAAGDRAVFRPVAVTVDKVAAEVNADVLIRRGKEHIAPQEVRRIRDLP